MREVIPIVLPDLRKAYLDEYHFYDGYLRKALITIIDDWFDHITRFPGAIVHMGNRVENDRDIASRQSTIARLPRHEIDAILTKYNL